MDRQEQVEKEVSSGSILEIRFSSGEISTQYKVHTRFNWMGQEIGVSGVLEGILRENPYMMQPLIY